MEIYTSKLPRWWFLRPWYHCRRLHQALIAVTNLSNSRADLLFDASEKQYNILKDRDRAIILANKWRYKYESKTDLTEFNERY
jgi:hypothetical protein